MTTSYQAFGQITAHVGDQVRTLTRRRESDLLALLLVARGRPVSADRILLELWGAEDLASGPASVQVAVSRLRAWLDPGRSGPRPIERTPAGYVLEVGRADVDVWVFEELVQQALAARTPSERLLLATRASDLWVGEPFAACHVDSVQCEASRLQELLVTLHETRAEALLALGRPAPAVRLLAPACAAHPYREELWALLARAQYACARQADALATLATLRASLAEDLGVDPSPVIRAMEQRILAQDPGLLSPAQAATGALAHRRPRRVVRRCRAASVTGALHLAG
jgi:DNA-binding SARP family transcriptional activator